MPTRRSPCWPMPSAHETAVLGAHRLPRQRGLAASRSRADAAAPPRLGGLERACRATIPQADLCVTYWMNALQGIDPAQPLFVTLNPPRPAAAELTFGRFSYAHPQYDAAARSPPRRRLPPIQGRNRDLVLRQPGPATASTRTASRSGLARGRGAGRHRALAAQGGRTRRAPPAGGRRMSAERARHFRRPARCRLALSRRGDACAAASRSAHRFLYARLLAARRPRPAGATPTRERGCSRSTASTCLASTSGTTAGGTARRCALTSDACAARRRASTSPAGACCCCAIRGMLGYVFNPLSVYFAYGPTATCAADRLRGPQHLRRDATPMSRRSRPARSVRPGCGRSATSSSTSRPSSAWRCATSSACFRPANGRAAHPGDRRGQARSCPRPSTATERADDGSTLGALALRPLPHRSRSSAASIGRR